MSLLLACDGSCDPATGLAAWGVALCRRPDQGRGIESRSGNAPRSVTTPHAAEAWAARVALEWARKLGARSCVLVTDCHGLRRLLRGERTTGIDDALLGDLVAAAQDLRWELVALDGRDPQAQLRRQLHERCHRAAVTALRKRRKASQRRAVPDGDEDRSPTG